MRSWPQAMRRDLRQRLGLSRRTSLGDPRLHAGRDDQPYWVVLPFWLAEMFRGKKPVRGYGKLFMRDILWGQYCLFVFIRLQDDIFDRHTDRPTLIYASDMFLIEADRVFARHFPKPSPFWKIYRTSIEDTLSAVVTADSLEQKPVRDRAALLEAHGGTSTICNIAPAALCLKAGRMRAFKSISVFSTEMMKAGAIVDDILDMEEDVERGRFNFATSYFLRGAKMEGPWKTKVRAQIARNLLFGDGLSGLFFEINRHLDRAESAMNAFAVPAAYGYLRSYRRLVAEMEGGIRLQGVERSFRSKGRIRG